MEIINNFQFLRKLDISTADLLPPLAIDVFGNLYSVGSDRRIVVFDDTGRRTRKLGGGLLASIWGGNGRLSDLCTGMVVDDIGKVFVVDCLSGQIRGFDETGRLILKWGMKGGGAGQFDLPSRIALDKYGRIYITDTGNHRIQVFDVTGQFLLKWGIEGEGEGQFRSPAGVATGGNNRIYVTDEHNNRIQVFDTNGRFLAKWGQKGSGDGQFRFPSGIALDDGGNVFVADGGNHRVQVFDETGTFLTKWGVEGDDDGQFSFPNQIVIDRTGKVYVMDHGHGIQMFGDVSLDQEIFWDRVDMEGHGEGYQGGCWYCSTFEWAPTGEWQIRDPDTFEPLSEALQKYAFETLYEPIPEGSSLRHTCGNRDCVNFSHLRLFS